MPHNQKNANSARHLINSAQLTCYVSVCLIRWPQGLKRKNLHITWLKSKLSFIKGNPKFANIIP